MSLQTILTPFIGALIGYFTNWLAIKMLFRPHNEIRVKGIKIPFTPGLIPKERARLTRKIASTVSEHLLTPSTLTERITAALLSALTAHADDIKRGIYEFVASLETEKLISDNIPSATEYIMAIPDKYPEVERTLTDLIERIIKDHVGSLLLIVVSPKKIYSSIKSGLFDYIQKPENQLLVAETLSRFLNENVLTEDNIHEQVDKLSARVLDIQNIEALVAGAVQALVANLDLERMIEDNMNSFSIQKAEDIIMSVVSKELTAITWIGALLGFVIGLVTALGM